MNNSELDFSDVIFSGGTGRSGTTILGKLLSRHSQIGLSRPAEVKIHVAGNGLLDLYLGKKVGRYKHFMLTDSLHLKRFQYRLFNDWWVRDPKVGEIAGLIQGIQLEELEHLMEVLKSNWKSSKAFATINFMRRFVDSQKQESRKKMWIETTPLNLFRADELADFLPGCRFIHMVRDGRDVIASVVRESWGPNTYEDGLIWYRRRMRRILRNTNELGNQVLSLALEDFVVHKRTESIEKLMAFLKIPMERKVVKYFESDVIPDKVQRGRWKSEVKDVDKFNEDYLKIVEELKAIDSSVPLST